MAGTEENPGPTTNVDVNQATELTMRPQWCSREKPHGECRERPSEQATEIRVEKVDTKVGTTQLFGLLEAGGVTVADREEAKPTPDAAKDEAWAAR